jgi:hypothetical protein
MTLEEASMSSPFSSIFNATSVCEEDGREIFSTEDAYKLHKNILKLKEEVFRAENVIKEKNGAIERLKRKWEVLESKTLNSYNTAHFKEAFVKFAISLNSISTEAVRYLKLLYSLLEFSQEDMNQIENERISQHRTSEGKGILFRLFGM